VPLIVREASSDAFARLIASLHAGELAISHWTRVEFASFLGREVRVGTYDRDQAGEAAARFASVIDTTFEVILPLTEDFDRAAAYLANYESGLRGGDALHLAIAANRRAEAIYTLDKGLLRAGRMLGLPVRAGIDLPGYEG
jgi:predicted nucleic acid-binding protein